MYQEHTLDNWSSAVEWSAPQPMAQTAAPQTVRYCRDLAQMIGASSFSLFFTVSKGKTNQLTPAFDNSFPGLSPLTTSFADDFAQQAATAAMPLWWCACQAGCFLEAEARNWATRITNPMTDAAMADSRGIAFPVVQKHGCAGVVVFSGDDLVLDQQLLCEIHACCHTLFAEVARQRPLASALTPSMSKREIECLRLTANGLTSDNIATRLGLSIHTANQYLTGAAQKLNAVNRIHAVAKALRLGLID